MAHGAWCGAWSMAHGVAHGAWRMAHGAWCDAWCMAHGAWVLSVDVKCFPRIHVCGRHAQDHY
eukprot:249894-Chlamydomonas_euryale.AAC.2